ncbi:MAG: hypothetical protein NC132_03460 [Corallococcus sp.]|nr:hypothetical protein [Corallococcus sp.]MCM1359560.1 hypothetical protein [Corallococcus sp.]MCM1395152.1 hypothetical protein [Corallococcus sp.]
MKKIVTVLLIIILCLMFIQVFVACRNYAEPTVIDDAPNLIYSGIYNFAMSSLGLGIIFSTENESAEFECKSYKAELIGDRAFGYESAYKITAEKSLTWCPYENREIMDIPKDYVDIIVKIDGQIVGYGVVEITQTGEEPLFSWESQVLVAKIFPKVDGKYQTVSEKYVIEKMTEAKIWGGVQ